MNIQKQIKKRLQKDFDSIEGHCHRKGSKHHKPKGSSQYPAPLTYFYWKEARVRQAHKWSEIFSKFSGFPVWSWKFNCLTWKGEKEIVKNYELLQKFNQNLLMITWKTVGPHIKPWIPDDHHPEFQEKYEVHWDRGHNNSTAHHANYKLEYKLLFCGKEKN